MSKKHPKSTIADVKNEAVKILADDLLYVRFLVQDVHADLALLDAYQPTSTVTDLVKRSAVTSLESAAIRLEELEKWVEVNYEAVRDFTP